MKKNLSRATVLLLAFSGSAMLSGCNDQQAAPFDVEACEEGLAALSAPFADVPALEAVAPVISKDAVVTEEGRLLVPATSNYASGIQARIWTGTEWVTQQTVPAGFNGATKVFYAENGGRFQTVFSGSNAAYPAGRLRISSEQLDGSFGLAEDLGSDEAAIGSIAYAQSEDLSRALVATDLSNPPAVMLTEKTDTMSWSDGDLLESAGNLFALDSMSAVYTQDNAPVLVGMQGTQIAATQRAGADWLAPVTLVAPTTGVSIQSYSFKKVPGQNKALLMWIEYSNFNQAVFAQYIDLSTLAPSSRKFTVASAFQ